jgi:hypothetical protein
LQPAHSLGWYPGDQLFQTLNGCGWEVVFSQRLSPNPRHALGHGKMSK